MIIPMSVCVKYEIGALPFSSASPLRDRYHCFLTSLKLSGLTHEDVVKIAGQ